MGTTQDTIEQIMTDKTIPQDVIANANAMAGICGAVVGLKYLDYFTDSDRYFERVKSGFYDDLEKDKADD